VGDSGAQMTPKVLPGAPQREPKSVKNHQKVVSEPPWVSTGDLWGALTAKITQITSKITQNQCFFVEI